MKSETPIYLRGEKNARIIKELCENYSLTPEVAADFFFRSATASMIENKIADLHCRSEKYLASLIMEEYA